MGAAFFWGIILILIGFSVIVRVVFQLDIFRYVVAFFFILLGIKLLIGMANHGHEKSKKDILFESTQYNSIEKQEYNLVLGSNQFDLRNIPADELNKKVVKIKTIFGSSIFKLNPAMPVKIDANAVFGDVEMPDNSKIFFGSGHYSSEEVDTIGYLNIEADAIFGRIEFRK